MAPMTSWPLRSRVPEEDLVLAAIHDAVARVTEAQNASLGGLMPNLGGMLGSGTPELE